MGLYFCPAKTKKMIEKRTLPSGRDTNYGLKHMIGVG